jgi:hypothetical protein
MATGEESKVGSQTYLLDIPGDDGYCDLGLCY